MLHSSTAVGSAPIADGNRLAFVDGFRAIAVLLVLLFHFDIPGFSNGFLGVDIFFVISGFVVTRMILQREAESCFRFTEFYIARYLRIAPTLYVWTAVSVIFAASLFSHEALLGTISAGIASIAFISNRHAFNNYSYFDHDLVNFPMLHHWSLAVEMQFYLVTPLLIITGHRYLGPKQLRVAVIALAVVSMLCFHSAWYDQPLRAFYMPTTRAWEYFAGAFVALTSITNLSSKLQIAVLLTGLIAMLAGIMLGEGFSIVPVALVVYGTMLILIFFRGQVVYGVRQVLERAPIVALGRISYSVYLVHWPVFIFAQYWWVVPLPLGMRCGLMIISVGLGWLSWWAIEQRFRPSRTSFRATLLRIAAVTALGLAVVGLALAMRSQARLDSETLLTATKAAAIAEGISPMRQKCHASILADRLLAARSCVLGARVRPDVAIWGDSHGVELSFVLSNRLRTENRAVLQKTTSSCPPWVEVIISINPRCRQQNSRILSEILANSSIRTIVLVMHRHAYAESDESIIASLRKVTSRLRSAGKAVILVAPFPNPSFHVPDGLMRWQRFWPDRAIPSIARRDKELYNLQWMTALGALAKEQKIDLVDPAEWMCGAKNCPLLEGHQPLYFDDNHPTLRGLAGLATHIADITDDERRTAAGH